MNSPPGVPKGPKRRMATVSLCNSSLTLTGGTGNCKNHGTLVSRGGLTVQKNASKISSQQQTKLPSCSTSQHKASNERSSKKVSGLEGSKEQFENTASSELGSDLRPGSHFQSWPAKNSTIKREDAELELDQLIGLISKLQEKVNSSQFEPGLGNGLRPTEELISRVTTLIKRAELLQQLVQRSLKAGHRIPAQLVADFQALGRDHRSLENIWRMSATNVAFPPGGSSRYRPSNTELMLSDSENCVEVQGYQKSGSFLGTIQDLSHLDGERPSMKSIEAGQGDALGPTSQKPLYQLTALPSGSMEITGAGGFREEIERRVREQLTRNEMGRIATSLPLNLSFGKPCLPSPNEEPDHLISSSLLEESTSNGPTFGSDRNISNQYSGRRGTVILKRTGNKMFIAGVSLEITAARKQDMFNPHHSDQEGSLYTNTTKNNNSYSQGGLQEQRVTRGSELMIDSMPVGNAHGRHESAKEQFGVDGARLDNTTEYRDSQETTGGCKEDLSRSSGRISGIESSSISGLCGLHCGDPRSDAEVPREVVRAMQDQVAQLAEQVGAKKTLLASLKHELLRVHHPTSPVESFSEKPGQQKAGGNQGHTIFNVQGVEKDFVQSDHMRDVNDQVEGRSSELLSRSTDILETLALPLIVNTMKTGQINIDIDLPSHSTQGFSVDMRDQLSIPQLVGPETEVFKTATPDRVNDAPFGRIERYRGHHRTRMGWWKTTERNADDFGWVVYKDGEEVSPVIEVPASQPDKPEEEAPVVKEVSMPLETEVEEFDLNGAVEIGNGREGQHVEVELQNSEEDAVETGEVGEEEEKFYFSEEAMNGQFEEHGMNSGENGSMFSESTFVDVDDEEKTVVVSNGKPESESVVVKPQIVLHYETGWEKAYVHYSADNGAWTDVPGVVMESSVATYEEIPWKVLSIEGETLEFVLTNGANDWDKSPEGGNYAISRSGVYLLSFGEIREVNCVSPVEWVG